MTNYESTTRVKDHPRKVLFVYDEIAGHVTYIIRGLIFKDLFLQNGWNVEYISCQVERGIGDKRGKKTEYAELYNRIVNTAKNYPIVYLLKVRPLGLIKRLRRETRARLIFDLTDALWMSHFRKKGWNNIERILASVDAVFTELDNEPYYRFASRYNNHIFGQSACTQIERFDELNKNNPPHDNRRIIIGWVGSKTTTTALSVINDTLDLLALKYPSIELRLLGADSNKIPAFQHIRYTNLPEYNEDDMIREIIQMDIGLFPPPGDIEDYKIRGALKVMLYMSGGVPPVALGAGNCSKIIVDGRDGMLVKSPSDWFEKLDLLIASPGLRREMGRQARESIRAGHSLQHVFKQLEQSLIEVSAIRSNRKTMKAFKALLPMVRYDLQTLSTRQLIKKYLLNR